MNPIIRNILAVLIGITVGMMFNGKLIEYTSFFIAPPEGVNPNDLESIKANINLYGFKHFIVPFIAHAGGTLIGAIIVVKIAISHHLKFALGIGVLFLIGGIAVNYMIFHPIFSPFDIIVSYIPMGWLGYKIAKS